MEKQFYNKEKAIDGSNKTYDLKKYTGVQYLLKYIKQISKDTFIFKNFTGVNIKIKLQSEYDINLINSLNPKVFDFYLFAANMEILGRFDEEQEKYTDLEFFAKKITHAVTPKTKLDIKFLEQFTKEKNNRVYIEY